MGIRFKRKVSASRIFCPIKNSLRSEEVVSTWKFFAKKKSEIIFSKKKFPRWTFFPRWFLVWLQILKKKSIFEKSKIFIFFWKFRNFDGKSISLRISYEKNPSQKKYFFDKNHGKICFLKKNRGFFFQVDITSSDLNEFWIGQKILKAETFLLNLIPTFMGLRPI